MEDKFILPEAFIERMKQMLMEESDTFFSAYENNNHLSLRYNPLKKIKEGNKLSEIVEENFESVKEAVPWEDTGRYYEETDAPGKHPFHKAGAYYIQEASAMAPVHFLMQEPLKEGERILDLCAAPGGKTTQIAGYMQGRGLLICNEIVPKRAKILSENIERMGVENALVISHDPEDIKDRFAAFFSRILVDAPCSGEGMFRKHPEAIGEWSEENVKLCAARQDGILDCAANMLMPGGTLVYSTCTFAREEDEECIERFLSRHEEFEEIRPSVVGGISLSGYGARLFPHRLKGEGHYLAVLKKKGKLSEKLDMNLKAQKATLLDKDEKKVFEEFLKDTIKASEKFSEKESAFLKFGDNLYLMPVDTPDLKGLKVIRPGLHLGSFEKKRFTPSHALALALGIYQVNNSIELSYDEARQYLAGMTVNNAASGSLKKGWCLVTHEGMSLGWGKNAGGILKNHYPKGLRMNL